MMNPIMTESGTDMQTSARVDMLSSQYPTTTM